MKKIIPLICICLVLSAAMARAEYGRQIFNDSTVKSERPLPYMKHVNSWKPVDQEKIYTDSDDIVFHTDSKTKEFHLNAEVMPINASDKSLLYASNDESIATVDDNGVVRATGKIGNAIITITSGKIKKECNVSMRNGVKSVLISENKLTLYADKSSRTRLRAAVMPEDATVKDIIWYSEDASIAAVDENGIVTPCGVGETNIIVKTVDGSRTNSCHVSVSLSGGGAAKAESEIAYTHYPYKLDSIIDKQMETNPTIFSSKAYPAYRNELEQCIDPSLFTTDYEKYQFLDLSSPNGIDAQTLNNYLSGKGVLDGMGEVFIEAAREYNLSEVYLAVHAALESGNGFSQLASGVDVNGITVYNMFGIGAVDSDPLNGGANYAYSYGWTSVEAAIRGGAEWISSNYVNSGQNTLYKMRWNPDQPAVHQYASDVEWAIKQAKTLKNMFDAFPSAKLRFEIPVYKGQSEPKFN